MLSRSLTGLIVACVVVGASCHLAFCQETATGGAGSADTSLTEMLKSVEQAPAEAKGPEGEGFWGRVRQSGLIDLYIRGGVFMHPLLLSSIVGVAIIIERLYTLSKAKTDVRRLMKRVMDALHTKGVEAATAECESTRGPVAAILHAGLKRADMGTEAVERAIVTAGTIETSFLERGLIWLASVTTIAPLLGFLGTVSGMIHAFNAIAEAEQVSAKLVAAGISEALITTAAGLMIAIPVQSFHNYFISQIERFVLDMEESSNDLINALVTIRTGGK